ncbi:MAG: 6-phosphofructokinase [Anaerovoracaceae bacterium]
MKKIAILTSGGDAPGMNAAIRAIVRSSIKNNIEAYGIMYGYDGLIDNDFVKLDISSVGDIIHRGGTILKTARSDRFRTEEGQYRAIENLTTNNIDGLIVIGGDGSLRGAKDLTTKGINVIVLPATIDNDMGSTDFTIGFDTAVNTVLDAISKIRDTGCSHDRTSIIEVMGRSCGDIALQAGLAGGADFILIPELPIDLIALSEKIKRSYARDKKHSIIVKAEGVSITNDKLAKYINDKVGEEARITVLGYLQRGGSPTNRDRVIASLMGAAAVDLVKNDDGNKVVVWSCNDIDYIDIDKAVTLEREADLSLLSLIMDLS